MSDLAPKLAVSGRRRRAFTLLEVLLVLALIGLLATVLITGGTQLLNREPTSPDDIFWAAVQEARKMALKSETDAVLRFVDEQDKGKSFVITCGGTTKQFAVPKAGDLQITFLLPQTGGNTIMIAGTVLETEKLSAVTFYSDGTCQPFRTQFFRNGSAHIVSIDPWTCAQVLTTTDANGNPLPPSS